MPKKSGFSIPAEAAVVAGPGDRSRCSVSRAWPALFSSSSYSSGSITEMIRIGELTSLSSHSEPCCGGGRHVCPLISFVALKRLCFLFFVPPAFAAILWTERSVRKTPWMLFARRGRGPSSSRTRNTLHLFFCQ